MKYFLSLHVRVAPNVGVPDGRHVGGAMGGVSAAGGVPVGSYDLDEFGDELTIEEVPDFAFVVRSKLASEHKQKSSVSGFEVRAIPVCLVKRGRHVFAYDNFV